MQITMFEFRGKKKECLAIDDNWSELDLVQLFRRSGWTLEINNITSRWSFSEANVEDFPEERKISMRMANVSELPKSESMLSYVRDICKATLIPKY